MLDGGEVSLLVGGRDVAGGVCRAQVVTLLGRIIKASSPSYSLSKNMKMNTQNNETKGAVRYGCETWYLTLLEGKR